MSARDALLNLRNQPLAERTDIPSPGMFSHQRLNQINRTHSDKTALGGLDLLHFQHQQLTDALMKTPPWDIMNKLLLQQKLQDLQQRMGQGADERQYPNIGPGQGAPYKEPIPY